MGWTSTDARFYTADGKVNRQAECDALYTWEGEKTKNEVIKSSMRGSVYYAAVRTTDKTTGHSEVFAAVCLTSTRRDGGFNFGYKGMAEDMGPCEDDCPKGILVLLTDTESKYAKEWRERCWAKIRDKKQNRQSLASIKIGEIIEFERGGVTIRAEKMAPAYQFKTPWFKVVGKFEYVHKTEIKDWRIVADNAATLTEAPQISTETAETGNVSAEGEKGAETRENTPKRKIQYFHYTPEQLKRYIIDVYEKNANDEWVLLPYQQIDTDKCFWKVINGKIGEWDRMQERFTEVNMDFNSPTCGRCFKINRTYQQDYFIVSNEKLLEFTINGNYYYIQKQTYSKGKHRWCYTIMDAYGDFAVDDFSYTKRGIMQRFNKWWKKNATIIWQASETPTEPPQSPEAPQTIECTTDTPKPRETARKPQNRGIGNTRHSRLGANGYAMLDNASATLTAMHVPRECSTADYW